MADDIRRLDVTENDRERLAEWIAAGTTAQRVVMRARIVLLASEGRANRAIARELGISPHTAALWKRHFQAQGAECLLRDAPGRGRKTRLTAEAASRLRDLQATPHPAGERWTIRRLASASGMSRATVHRLLRLPSKPDA